ncbi:hypothetical protein WJX74_006307 [Apatococcus lobatus]|uniref:Fibronectin type-III domain-containing protein n=1 Tax=Apatococcus lobatus TaxID=904363 RepID=A0AAW1RHI3_9CHLO
MDSGEPAASSSTLPQAGRQSHIPLPVGSLEQPGSGMTASGRPESPLRRERSSEDLQVRTPPQSEGLKAGPEDHPVICPYPIFGRPQAPVVESVDTHSLSLSWAPVQLQGQGGNCLDEAEILTCGVGYSLEMQLVGTVDETAVSQPVEDRWSCCHRGSDLNTQVNGLRPGRKYAFRLQIHPIIVPPWSAPPEPQEPSPPMTCSTPATAPSPPHAPTVSARDRRILTFKWRPPDEPGGPAITAYHFQISPPPDVEDELKQDGAFAEVYVGKDIRCRIPRLMAGTVYITRVKAVNMVGESGWSELAECMTAASVPNQPEAPYITTSTTTSAILGWQAPCDNGAPILHYQVECDDGAEGSYNLVYTGPETGLEAEGLESGLTYRFRVTAFNAAGRSLAGQPAFVQTAPQAPGAPSQVRALGSNLTSATIVWAGPDEDGGSPITHYAVQLQPASPAALADGMPPEWVVVYTGRSAACTAGGLRAGCTYCVRVCAFNLVGEGAFSVPVNISTAADVAWQPSPPQASQRWQHALQLAWQPPRHDGGSAIQAYRLEGCRVGALEVARQGQRTVASKGKQALQPLFAPMHLPHAALDCTATVHGLECGTEYLFRVHAVNRLGASPVSQPGRAQTQAAAPSQPLPPEAQGSPGPSSIRLTWDEPYHNGAWISSYTLQQSMPSWHLPQDMNRRDVHDGTNGHLAASSASDTPTTAQEANAVCTPSQSSSEPDLDSGGADHSMPMANGHGPHCSSTVAYEGPDRQTEVKGLEPACKYVFKVRASNAAGPSRWSETCTIATSAAPPSCTRSVTAEGTSSEAVAVSWQEPARDNGAPVISYDVEFCSQSRSRSSPTWHPAATVPAASRHCQVEGLQSGRAYSFRVRARNDRGQSRWSEEASAATLPAPPDPCPPPTFAARTATSVRVRWEGPAEDHGAAVTSYRLQFASTGSNWRQVYTGSNTSQKVADLAPGQEYNFRVAACNAVGCGPWGAAAPVTTLLQPPQPPTSITLEADTSSSDRPVLLVHWEPATSPSDTADCASQEVECINFSEPAASPKPATCSGRATDCSLPGLHAGCTYQVRVRCIGAAGTGHGAWSQGVSLDIPGPRQMASHATDPTAVPGLPRNRRSGRDLRQLDAESPDNGATSTLKTQRVKRADSRSLGLKSAAAKAPSKYRHTWLGKAGVPPKMQRQLKELLGRSKSWAALLIVVVVIFVVYKMRDSGKL